MPTDTQIGIVSGSSVLRYQASVQLPLDSLPLESIPAMEGYSADALPQMADAISIVMVVFIMLSYLIANKVFHADISKSMG